jgi:16S rRNA processing protein RimM
LTAFSELVAIGRVVKPQGRKGEVLTECLSDFPSRFQTLSRAFVLGERGAAHEIAVTSCWPHKGRFVLKIEGVDSINAAEGYRGQEIRVPEEELPALPEGTYYHHELVGLRVEDPAGRSLGTVAELMETGGEAKVLVVRSAKGEALYPMAASFVKRVDIPSGRLVIDPQETVDAAD